ncbi:MAG: rhomboid family intramembrane serine protease, partial [Lachnospiraceae bacterium]|nr:rhomboid family intramembrane serine protease [Lachnospiraceae bacterium]
MVRHRGIPVTAALVAVNVLVFLLQEIPGPLSDRIYEDGVLVTQNVLAGEYWRLFTSMFLHANIEHIFSNMLMLYYV